MVYNVDYISTDQPKALAEVLERLAKSSYTSKVSHQPYQPKYKNFDKKRQKYFAFYTRWRLFTTAIRCIYRQW